MVSEKHLIKFLTAKQSFHITSHIEKVWTSFTLRSLKKCNLIKHNFYSLFLKISKSMLSFTLKNLFKQEYRNG